MIIYIFFNITMRPSSQVDRYEYNIIKQEKLENGNIKIYKIKQIDFCDKIKKYKREELNQEGAIAVTYSVRFDKKHKYLTFRTEEYYAKGVASKDASEITLYLTELGYKECKKLSTYNMLQTKPEHFAYLGKECLWTKDKFPHRENDLPALIGKGYYANDVDPNTLVDYDQKEWYIDGDRHRENNLPAVIYRNDTVLKVKWYEKDFLHRIDGPARVIDYGAKCLAEYYQNGVQVSDKDKLTDGEIRALALIQSYFN